MGKVSNIPLPPEILSEIFHLAKAKRRPYHLVPLEVIFSHVCSDWRNTLLADSQVWTNITIHSPKTLPRALAYLSRTAPTSVVYVRVELYDWDRKTRDRQERNTFLESLNAFLESCIERCKTLLIFTYRESTSSAIVKSLSASAAPELERLRINNLPPDVDSNPRDLEHPDVLTGGAPSLQFLEIEGIHSFPPLGSLVTLHLHNLKPDWFTYDVFKDISTKSVNLQNLSLEAQTFVTAWPNDTARPSITLKSLRSLRITEHFPGLLVKLLLTINAPRLQSLWLVAETTSFDFLFDSPQFLASQSKFANLKYLTLDSYNMHSLHKFGLVFPNITHFFIPEAPLFHLKHLAAAFSSDPPLWPKLETLAMTAKSDRRQMNLKEALCKIVSARAEMRVGLKRFLSHGDTVEFLKKQESDLLNEHLDIEELCTENFREPWWLMMHESHPDSIGLS
ncbi:hypothetical protein CC1G_14156 [Coprinopsis cinerea okayama7|uniref:Uncharacterized protein n=1 Tax=Coprinopsis cinerea (strain Okayama-7 / 130 / ATCC MYA-4618 / FGSC 9003) TaxID=240176 RepID=D6RLL7_COPC7|nr:hypothetical protein CC1G_14156 [Coprinopsis cinerea okayama7\|eukprot:XP_002911623.1 hypothetical protein CC1G_14156 [Coprinopsis cinerea okayama7\